MDSQSLLSYESNFKILPKITVFHCALCFTYACHFFYKSPIMNNQDTSVLLASFDNELSNEMEVDNQTFNSVSLLKTSVSDTKAHHKSKRSRKKCSRVGSSYQVVEFPMPGIYLVESKKLE